MQAVAGEVEINLWLTRITEIPSVLKILAQRYGDIPQ